jgi:hypothetical protein
LASDGDNDQLPRGSRATRTAASTPAGGNAELAGSVPRQSVLLQLLDFGTLAVSHLSDELLNGEVCGLSNLYELHGRKSTSSSGWEESPVGTPGITRW